MFVPALLSTIILHWLPRRAVKFPPVPIKCMYPTLLSHFSVLSYCTGSLAQSCTFLLFLYIVFTLSCPAPSQFSHTALSRLQSPVFSPVPLHYYVRYFDPPTVSSVISHWLALRVLYFLLFLYTISLICDMSVTTQNFGIFELLVYINVCRCTFNSFITQFVTLAAGEQLCRRCSHRKA
jgi:hypothetical protein